MASTRDSKNNLAKQIKNDPKSREEMIWGGLLLIFSGKPGGVEEGKIAIRNYIKATIGFSALSKRISIPKESIMRMLSPTGNPTLDNLDKIIQSLLEDAGVQKKAKSK